jgi:DNA adenine methylase
MVSAGYRKLWEEQKGKERQFYDVVRKRFNLDKRPVDFLYLLARCVKASIRYNALGEFNQSPDNRRKGMHPDTMQRLVSRVSQLMKGRVKLSAKDYSEVLESATTDDVVYMDPPYQGVCRSRDPRYSEGLGFSEFVEALRYLNERDISYIVSYDGRTGTKVFGHRLPESLQLRHIEVAAGRSSQATLLGRNYHTYESLYVSPALVSRKRTEGFIKISPANQQLSLSESVA